MANFAFLQLVVSALEGKLSAVQASIAAQLAKLADAQALARAKEDALAAAKRALREAETEALKQLVLAPLFPELASLVFALLPVDARLRCREVSRGWRAFLADARHWQVLDLSLSSGVARRSLALLRAASEHARGTLRQLDVSSWYYMPVGVGEEALRNKQLLLLPVLRANAASLLELRAWKPVDSEGGNLTSTVGVEDLLAAAPRLRLLECDAILEGEDARGPLPRLLREPQFAPLRLLRLYIDANNVQPPPDVPALAAWAATHASLKRLDFWRVPLDSQLALDAVVHLATSQLQYLCMENCSLSPASLPGLTRMLESRSLTVLCIWNGYAPLIVGAAVPAFCAALRASRLVSLELCRMCLWELQADGLAVIAACTGHPTLREISFMYNDIEDAPGRAVIEGALVALQESIPGLCLTYIEEEEEEEEE